MNERPTPETEAVMTDPLRDGNDLPDLARRLERERDALREELEDWRNAAKGAENPHPDEQHCTCVPLLHKLLKEAREAFVIATDQLVQAQMEIRRLRDIEP
jgi:hypothetical protein